MKKFLIVIILLVPIIVLLALNASSSIISMITPDNPTDIEIRDSSNRVIGRDDIIRIDMKTENEFIMVDILPLMTKENEINVPEKDDSSVGDIELERLQGTNKYYVKPIKVGMVKVILSALLNVNVRRAVTFNVTSDSIEYLSIYNHLGSDVDSTEVYYPTESQQLYFDIFPIEALSHNLVSWKVTNGTAVEISPNGYVTIVEKGLAVVRVMAKDKNQNLVTKEVIIDTSNAVVKESTVYVEDDFIGEAFVNDNYALDPANSVTTKISEDKFRVVRTDPETEESSQAILTVVKVDKNDWDFSDQPDILYTNNGPHFLKVVNLLTNRIEEKATFEISDTLIAQLDTETGALVPIKPGYIEVTAHFDRTEKKMLIQIKERVSSFELDLGTEDAKLGIQLTRKWGNYWLTEDGGLTNQYRFGLYNKNPDFDVVWSSSDPSVISFELIEDTQEVMLTFHEEGTGKSAIIAADLVVNNRIVPGIRRTFEFKLMDTPNYINVNTFADVKKIAFDEEYNVCMQSNIIADEILQLVVGISFYGNGFLYDGSSIPLLAVNTAAINIFREYYRWDKHNLTKIEGKNYFDSMYVDKDLSFEEMRMQNAPDVKSAVDRGACITVLAAWRGNIDFKYMQIKNAERGIEVIWCRDVSIEGCILGDNFTYSIVAVYPEFPHSVFEDRRPTFFLKNTVLKHCEGPAVAFSYGNSADQESLAKGYMPEVTIEGFLDIYNWHVIENFEKIFSKIVIESLMQHSGIGKEAVNAIDKLLGQAFKEYFSTPEVSHIYYWKDNKKYVSVGVLALGSVFRPEIEMITCNDPRLAVLEIPMEDANGVPLSKSIGAIATLVKMILNIDTITNANNIICYDFRGKEPVVKPGDPVPQDYELYARLTGQSANLYS